MNCPNCGVGMEPGEDEFSWHCVKCEQDYEARNDELVAVGYTSDF